MLFDVKYKKNQKRVILMLFQTTTASEIENAFPFFSPYHCSNAASYYDSLSSLQYPCHNEISIT